MILTLDGEEWVLFWRFCSGAAWTAGPLVPFLLMMQESEQRDSPHELDAQETLWPSRIPQFTLVDGRPQ